MWRTLQVVVVASYCGLAVLLRENMAKKIATKLSNQRKSLYVFYGSMLLLLIPTTIELLLVLDEFAQILPTVSAGNLSQSAVPAARAQIAASAAMGAAALAVGVGYAYVRRKMLRYLSTDRLLPGSALGRLRLRLRYSGSLSILLLVTMAACLPARAALFFEAGARGSPALFAVLCAGSDVLPSLLGALCGKIFAASPVGNNSKKAAITIDLDQVSAGPSHAR